VIVDCLSLWVANLLEQSSLEEIGRATVAAADAAARRFGTTIVVSNEVGLGVVPATPLGRTYRDVLGSANAAWAERAEQALLVVAGQVQRLQRTESLQLNDLRCSDAHACSYPAGQRG